MDLTQVTAEVWVAVLAGLAASTEDLIHREISNWITGSAFVAGVACQVYREGWRGLLWALGGAAVAFAIFYARHWFFGMGGGDVKLMAGFGALLGIQRVLWATLYSAVIGGLLALSVVVWCEVRGLLRGDKGKAAIPESIPYGPALSLGAWLAMLPKS